MKRQTIQLPWISSGRTSTKSLQTGVNQASANRFMEIHIYAEWEDWIAASVMETLLLCNCASFALSIFLLPVWFDACESAVVTELVRSFLAWPAAEVKIPGPMCAPLWWSGLGHSTYAALKEVCLQSPLQLKKASEYHKGVTSRFSDHLLH